MLRITHLRLTATAYSASNEQPSSRERRMKFLHLLHNAMAAYALGAIPTKSMAVGFLFLGTYYLLWLHFRARERDELWELGGLEKGDEQLPL
jgi:hypothetical protein